jgi:predicted nucleic acid-binding protein
VVRHRARPAARRGTGRSCTDQLGELVALLHDPSSPLEAAPVTLEVAAAFQRIPRDALGDPWDRSISATAMALGLPLVTRDRKMPELEPADQKPLLGAILRPFSTVHRR